MQRPPVRPITRKYSQEPRPLAQQQQKKPNQIKTRMQSKLQVGKETRKPVKFANHTNLPQEHALTSKENISRSQEDTRVTEHDSSESEMLPSLCIQRVESGLGRSCMQLLAYRDQIKEYVLQREQKFMIEHDYMRKHRLLNLKMRSYLVKYMFRISYKFDLLRTTTYLAVHYMDLYFSRIFTFRDQLETVAVAQTCLFIAMKYEEIYPPDLGEWVDHRRKPDILKLEGEVLRVLDFQLAHYTLEHFAHFHLWHDQEADSQVPTPQPTLRSQLLMDLSLFDLPMRQFRPSQLAKVFHMMGNPGSLSNLSGEKEERQMVQNAVWMMERNSEALQYLAQHRYHGVEPMFN